MTPDGSDSVLTFVKYQALGNDYLVVDRVVLEECSPDRLARELCDRHYGAGADGLLVGPYPNALTPFGLRIYNPDGSEAEKSGNGLRIFAQYLFDQGLVDTVPFQIHTRGGIAQAEVNPKDGTVQVGMGRAVFEAESIPILGKSGEVIEEPLDVAGYNLRINAVSFGNPHCVVFTEKVSKDEVMALGPLLENHGLFPNRTNVQFTQVLDPENLAIQIWERSAGYTLSSGSSACAAAAVALHLGRCGPQVNVHMPGGVVLVSFTPDFEATLCGPVRRVYEGRWLVDR